MDPAPPVLTPAASTVTPPPPAQPSTASNATPPALPGFFQLLKETIELFKKRVWVFILLGLIASSVSPVINIAGGSASLFLVGLGLPELVELLVTFVVLFAGVLLSIWAWAALVFAVALSDEAIGVQEAFARSLKKIGSYLWLAALTWLLLVLGFFAFIVPAILFAIWFTFAQYVFVLEGKRGVEALLTSKEYVRGFFGAILGRYALLLLLACGVFAVLVAVFVVAAFALVFASPLLSMVGISVVTFFMFVVSVLATPLVMSFTFTLFKHIRQIKGGISATVTKKQRVLWGGLAGLGFFVGVLMFAGVVSIAALSAIKNVEDAAADETQTFELFPYQLALEFHYVEHRGYPATLGDMLIEDQSLTAAERTDINALSYEVSDDGQSYALCVSGEEDMAPVCVTGGDEDDQDDIVQ